MKYATNFLLIALGLSFGATFLFYETRGAEVDAVSECEWGKFRRWERISSDGPLTAYHIDGLFYQGVCCVADEGPGILFPATDDGSVCAKVDAEKLAAVEGY